MSLTNIEEQIIRGELLLRRLWASGRDTKVLEERVKKLKLMLNKQGNHDDKLLCESCLYRWIVNESYSVDRNKSYWCVKLKKRLVYFVDSCSEFSRRNR